MIIFRTEVHHVTSRH